MTAAAACPGHHRDAGDDQTPVDGDPTWCQHCTTAIRARLDELPGLVDLLEHEVAGQRGSHGEPPVSGSRERPSPSATVDDIDEITRLLEYWEDAARELGGHPPRPPRASARRARNAARWLAAHLVDVLAAPFAEELGRDITRLHRMARRRTATDNAKDRKPLPCPSCDLLTLWHTAGDKYIGCDHCGLLLSLDEYDTEAQLKAARHDTRRTA